MKSLGFTSKALVAAGFLLSTALAADVDPIVIKGSKFFYKTNGTEFFIRGIAYQEDYSSNGTISGGNQYTDPLSNATKCERDIPLLTQLRTNAIRVYAIDPTADHSQCMSMLMDAGIYVISDLSDPVDSINRDSPEWNLELYTRYTAVVDELQQYSNVMGFFAGNEVSNQPNNTQASVFVKAAVRDTKAYIKQKNYRPIGVGYATNDDDQRTNLADYFDCGEPADAIDFWGYNIYSWCGNSNIQSSHYLERTQAFASYNVPAFFAEYGCNTEARVFTEVGALFGPQMSPVWSGGVIYMYFEEANNYGLVTIGTDQQATKLPDFTALSTQIAKVSPSGVQMGSYNPTNSPQACPTIGSTWDAVEKLPPTPNEQLCNCMYQNLTCVAKSGISATAIQAQYEFLCDPANGNNCAGVTANGTTGAYGAYSGCNDTQRISWSMDYFYQNQTKTNPDNKNPCNFKGNAVKKTPQAPDSCKALASQAGAAGTGVVTSAPTGTASSKSHKSSGAAAFVTVPTFDLGLLKLASYLTVAVLVGAGMIVL